MKKQLILFIFIIFIFLHSLSVVSASYELGGQNVQLAEKAAPYVISISDLIEQEKALAEVRQLEQELQSLLATAKTSKERDKILKLLAELAEEHKGISAETKEYIKGFIDKTMQLPGEVLEVNPLFTGDISDLYASQFGETLFTGEKVDPAEVAAYAQVPFLTYRQGKIITEGAETVEKIVGGIRKRAGKIFGKGGLEAIQEVAEESKAVSKAEEVVEKAKGAGKGQVVEPFVTVKATGTTKVPALSTWGDQTTLSNHFVRHGIDFGAKNMEEYAQKASDFLRRSQLERFPTKVDNTGVIKIYDAKTNTFGAYNPDGTTRTFFKPLNPEYGYRQVQQ